MSREHVSKKPVKRRGTQEVVKKEGRLEARHLGKRGELVGT